MTRLTRNIAALAATLLASAWVTAAEAPVNKSGSSVVATFRQMGVDVDTPFTRFSGSINYDPANLAAAKALIEVETASLDFGDPAYNAEVAKKAWFDSSTHPKATFRSEAIKSLGAGKLEATGTLTIKGKAQRVSVPVTVASSASGNTFDGTITISRKAFGIGDAAWDGLLEDQVAVKFRFQSPRL